jgi:hypothetical protein
VIHGDYIRTADAEELVRVGIRVLQQLREDVRENALSPVRSETIDHEQVNELAQARYRVTTVIPYAESPKRNEYVLGQEQLDFFLDSYSDYAEFIVGIERIR